jgi:AcrR family transcriptional regulator
MQDDPLERAPAARSSREGRTRQPEAYQDERQRLLAAGMRVIVECGSVEPRVADIVRSAGLSNKAFYRHFRSRDELMFAILEEGIRRRVRELEARVASTASALEKVRIWVRGVLEAALDERLAAGLRPILVHQARLAETLHDRLWGHAQKLGAPLEAALEEGLRSGELPGVDPLRDTQAIYFLAMGWMHSRVLERRIPSREEAESLLEFALRGLRRTQAQERGA